ncbi:Tumor necrosis factor receptor superfamily member 14 [Merluccius polli]|uniref:Tumor necrosis factor receptor superfamily member 14 n=1 Tax=Merluccius polli TaxID=89951 RepID=A0AA47P7I9_MERPO|nr:Tumor necrosis factor receptor superfamily member 14 [Merluccius polli]
MFFLNVQFMFIIYLVLFHFIDNTFASVNCRQREYRIGEDCCPTCPPGMYVKRHCTEFTSTSCRPCKEGTFQDNMNGRERCYSCTNCDAGLGLKVKKYCTLCENLDGYFCIDSNRDGCIAAQRHMEQQIKTQSAFSVLMGHSQMAHQRLASPTQNVSLWDGNRYNREVIQLTLNVENKFKVQTLD